MNPVARVSRSTTLATSTNTLSPLRPIPIIVVPGIMGTRLSEAGGDLVWNPTGSPVPAGLGWAPGVFAANKERLLNVGARLVPDTTHPYDGRVNDLFRMAYGQRAAPIVNFLHLIPDFYGELMISMYYDLAQDLLPLGCRPVVYGSGYDWRQDNAESASLLAQVVERAREECGGEAVILIAHSMGGLVSRYYCRYLAKADGVRALFLVGSPTLGAPMAYGLMRTGLGFWDPIRRVANLSADQSRTLMRRSPAVYQLLPNHVYSSAVDRRWIEFSAARTGIPMLGPPTPLPPMSFSDCGDEVLLYLDIYVGLNDLPDFRDVAGVNIGKALFFHDRLSGQPGALATQAWMPPATWAIYGSSLPTDGRYGSAWEGITTSMGYNQVSSRTEVTSKVQGDGTVPLASGLPTQVSTPLRGTLAAGADHQGLPKAAEVISFLRRTIPSLV